MPKRARELTVVEVKALSQTVGKHLLGGVAGLMLRVYTEGNGRIRCAYALRVRRNGEEFVLFIGRYPQMSLSTARQKAQEILASGVDPRVTEQEEKAARKIEKERAASLIPFDLFVARAFEALREDGVWHGSERDERREYTRLAKYAFPFLAKKNVQDITPSDVAAVFEQKALREKAPSNAEKLRAILVKVFNYATRQNVILENPMYSPRYKALRMGAPKSRKQEGHMGALTPEQMPDFIAALVEHININSKKGQSTTTAKCLLFSILTCSRNSNATQAEWREFDLSKRVWVIPAEKMKRAANGDHTVYLSEQAVELVKSMPCIAGIAHVFTSNRGTALSQESFYQLLKKFNDARERRGLPPFVDEKQRDEHGEPVRVTQHGLARATYKTWTQTAKNSQGALLNAVAVELSLHHKNVGAGGLGAAYEREEFVEERRDIAQLWAEHCLSKTPREQWVTCVWPL